MYRKNLHIHFVGIGGIGMSGIAKILLSQGHTISGCDKDCNQPTVQELRSLGCHIFEGNNTPACHNPSIDILVYSTIIKHHNPEIIAAQQRGIPTINRALMLAELMRTKFSIAISGAHGKTTTTSLISHILLESKKDPTVIIGGKLHSISTNARLGKGDFLVAEADESDRSLAKLCATLAVVTNIDLEHLETYKDLDDIKNTFTMFLNNLPFYGKAIICSDCPIIRSFEPMPHLNFVPYGLDLAHKPFLSAQDIKLEADHSTYTLIQGRTQEILGTVHLAMPGIHNIQNSLAALCVAHELEIPWHESIQALSSFKGVDRRFTFRTRWHDAEIFDDYGHHPQELIHSFAVARKRSKNRLIGVFQPHRFTRTQKLWNDFVKELANAPLDYLILTDIYSASEDPLPGITGENLATAVKAYNPSMHVEYISMDEHFNQIKAALSKNASQDDLILLQGAGSINRLVNFL